MTFIEYYLIRKRPSARFAAEEVFNYSRIFVEPVISCDLEMRFRKATSIFSNDITKDRPPHDPQNRRKISVTSSCSIIALNYGYFFSPSCAKRLPVLRSLDAQVPLMQFNKSVTYSKLVIPRSTYCWRSFKI